MLSWVVSGGEKWSCYLGIWKVTGLYGVYLYFVLSIPSFILSYKQSIGVKVFWNRTQIIGFLLLLWNN
jgi:hypothetical protein